MEDAVNTARKPGWQKRRENALEKALRSDIRRLESGLTIADVEERVVSYTRFDSDGQKSKPGRIDIRGTDKRGATVIIELKAGKAGRRAIGQILGYRGALMGPKKPVRGFLIAKRFSPQGRAAARCVCALELRKISSLLLKSRFR
jgi:RecB family endonuclease NucS